MNVTHWTPILWDSPDSKYKAILKSLRMLSMSPEDAFYRLMQPRVAKRDVKFTASNRNAYIDEMVSCRNSRPWSAFGWMTKDQLAVHMGLEANRDWDAATTVSIAQYIRSVAVPSVRIIVGSQNEQYLLDVGRSMSGLDAWLEAQAPGGNPITVPLTRATFPAFLKSCQNVAAVYGVDHVWPGEWWMLSPDDMLWAYQQFKAAGFTHFGCGKFK